MGSDSRLFANRGLPTIQGSPSQQGSGRSGGTESSRVGHVQGVKVAVEAGLDLRSEAQHQ